jgi:hypothetical protein
VRTQPLDRDRITKLVSTIVSEDLHAKRVASLAGAAVGVLEGVALGIHAIGNALAGDRRSGNRVEERLRRPVAEHDRDQDCRDLPARKHRGPDDRESGRGSPNARGGQGLPDPVAL